MEHLLTHSAGFAWDEHSHPYWDERNTHNPMRHSASWVRFVMGLPMAHEPGEEFAYNTGGVHLLGAAIREHTGRHIDAYAREKLLEPLGISDWSWNRDDEGYPAAGGSQGGLRLRPRDLAKLGQLILDDGRWQGREVVPLPWVHAMVREKIKTGGSHDMAYLWWTGHMEIKRRSLDTVTGMGYGGQSLCVVPELKLVVVFTAWDNPEDAPIFGPQLRTVAAALSSEPSRQEQP